MMKTRSLMMKKCRNLKNEIKTRCGDSMNLLYCSHVINKRCRSYMYPCTNYLISEYVSVVSQDLYGLGLGYAVYSPKEPFFIIQL